LVRNVFMAIVIPFMAFSHSQDARLGRETHSMKTFPWRMVPLFVLGFLAMAVIRSIGDAGITTRGAAFGIWETSTWQSTHDSVKGWAENLMVLALAAVGLNTSLRAFRGLGIKPFLAGLVAALAVGVVSFIAITLLGSLVAL
jgi:uncharacterized membrane protein YadS